MRHIRAKSIYPGRIRGTMVEFRRERFSEPAGEKTAVNPKSEFRHFKSALRSAQLQLAGEKKMMLDRRKKSPGEILAIDDAIDVLESHIMTLEDPYFLGEIKNRIFNTGATAAAALGAVIGMVSRQFSFDTPGKKFEGTNQNRHFLKDMTDMKRRISYFLGLHQELTLPDGGDIVAAPKLTVSEVLALKRAGARGIIIGETSETAHELVMLRAMRIPCVSVSEPKFFRIKKAQPVLLDADIGYIVIKPRRSIRFVQTPPAEAKQRWSLVQRMRSGESSRLSGTMHFISELESGPGISRGTEYIGLYRTEYQVSEAHELISMRQMQKQYEHILDAHPKLEVTFRLFDFSDDKNFLNSALIEKDRDMRGIRFLLREKKILENQLTALIRAGISSGRKVRILIPYLTESHELSQVLAVIDELNTGRKKAVLSIGGMLENVEAISSARKFLAKLDFISVGTSDLLSAIGAVKRENTAALHRTLLGGAFRWISRELIHLARKKPVSLCGEITGEPWAIAWLKSLGFTEFVMPTHRIGIAANMLQAMTMADARNFNRQVTKIADEYERLERAKELALNILYGRP